MRRTLALGAVLAASLISAAPAAASFHLLRISEIHAGTGGIGDYVELQAPAAGENFVSAHYIQTYDNGGLVYSTFQFPSSAANGESQRTILVSDGGALPGGVAPDFSGTPSTLNIPTGGGTV